MGLDYTKIHECYNDYILYKKEYKKMNRFPMCGESHNKLKDNGVVDDDGVSIKGPPTNVMWYLLLGVNMEVEKWSRGG